MSKPDPITLKCCFCGNETKFEDQGQAISSWSVEENSQGEVFALCPKDSRNILATNKRSQLIMGIKEVKEEPEAIKEKILPKGIKMRARFKLEAIDVEVNGLTIAGDPQIKSIDLDNNPDYVIGAQYHVNLK